MLKSPFISRTTCCPTNLHPLSTSMHNTLEFSSGIWLLYLKFLLSHRVRYLLSNSTTSLYTLYSTFAQVTVHSSVFIVWSVLCKLATKISWVALNGTQGVQHRWVSLHSESAYRHWDGTKTPCWTEWVWALIFLYTLNKGTGSQHSLLVANVLSVCIIHKQVVCQGNTHCEYDDMTTSKQLRMCGWDGDETTFYITSKVAGSDKWYWWDRIMSLCLIFVHALITWIFVS